MAWIPIHQSILTHRKTFLMADLLELPEVHVAGHLMALWLWCLDSAPDGILPNSRRMISKAAHWSGSPDRFVDALIESGFVDCCSGDDGELMSIHDWQGHGGRLIEDRERRAQHMRDARAKRNNDSGLSRENNVTGTLPSREGHVTPKDKSRVDKSTEQSTEFALSAPPERNSKAPGDNSPVKETPKGKSHAQKSAPAISKDNPVYVAVMDVCEVDLSLASVEQITNATKCAKRFLSSGEARGLSPPEIAAQLRECRRRWDKLAWEGKDGDPPTPRQLQDKFPSLMKRSENATNGHNPTQPLRATPVPGGGFR